MRRQQLKQNPLLRIASVADFEHRDFVRTARQAVTADENLADPKARADDLAQRESARRAARAEWTRARREARERAIELETRRGKLSFRVELAHCLTLCSAVLRGADLADRSVTPEARALATQEVAQRRARLQQGDQVAVVEGLPAGQVCQLRKLLSKGNLPCLPVSTRETMLFAALTLSCPGI